MNEPKYKDCSNCRWKNVDYIDYPCNKCTLDEKWEWDRTTVDFTVLLKDKMTNGDVIKTITNGDVIKAMFPRYEFEVDEYNNEYGLTIREMITHNAEMRFDLSWWNAPYLKGVN